METFTDVYIHDLMLRDHDGGPEKLGGKAVCILETKLAHVAIPACLISAVCHIIEAQDGLTRSRPGEGGLLTCGELPAVVDGEDVAHPYADLGEEAISCDVGLELVAKVVGESVAVDGDDAVVVVQLRGVDLVPI